MEHYLKILKALISILLIVPFFTFGGIARADDTAAVSACVTTAIGAGFGTDIVTNIAGEYIPTASVTQTTSETLSNLGTVSGVNSLAATAKTAATALAVPVGDAVTNIYTGAIYGVNAAHSSFQDVGKMSLDALAYKVAQCTLEQLTNNTVKWIQSGFQGNPGFAVDVNKLFGDISEGVLADFSNQIKNLEACDFTINFKWDLANTVSLSAPKNNKFPTKIKCPFSPQTVTASQFYNDRSSFSWKLMETALSDSGNRFGVSALTAQEAARRQKDAKAKEDQKLGWSNGFADLIDTEDCPTMPAEVSIAIIEGQLPEEAVKFYQKSYCKTTTPGKIVGDSLMKAIGAKQDRIGFADNMNKIISALITELTTEATRGVFKALN